MSYRLHSFNGVALPTRVPESELGPGPAQDRAFLLPSGSMFDYWGSDDAPKAETTLRHRGRIYGTYANLSTLEDGYNDMRELIGKYGKLTRIRENDSRYQTASARCLDVRTTRRNENRLADGGVWLEVEFVFRMVDPWWDGYRRGSGWALDTGEELDAGLVLDDSGNQTMTGSPYYGHWNNAGNKDAVDAVITVTAGSAAITALSIARNVQGQDVLYEEDWDYSGTIAIGKALVVDCGAWSVEYDGADAWANFAFDTTNHATENILTMEPGDNRIRVTFTGGDVDSTINITFRDKWA